MVVVHHGGDGGEEGYIDVGAVFGTVDADVVIVVADAVLDAGGGDGCLKGSIVVVVLAIDVDFVVAAVIDVLVFDVAVVCSGGEDVRVVVATAV